MQSVVPICRCRQIHTRCSLGLFGHRFTDALALCVRIQCQYRTETRPDAPTTPAPLLPESNLETSFVPTSSKHPDIFHNRSCVCCLNPWFQVCVLPFVSPSNKAGFHALVRDSHALTSPLDTPPCGKSNGKPSSYPGPKVPSPLGPCFCLLCAPPSLPRSPERSLGSFELANKACSTRRSVSRKPKLPRTNWPKPETFQTPNHQSRRIQRIEILSIANASNRTIPIFLTSKNMSKDLCLSVTTGSPRCHAVYMHDPCQLLDLAIFQVEPTSIDNLCRVVDFQSTWVDPGSKTQDDPLSHCVYSLPSRSDQEYQLGN
jgi:hypothetical protein